ncbi:MAG: hypothetical protein JW864_09860 [Spirochaetes bacterium]|nr:hypothetical protein [Spirochaetota bacterium]
MEDCKNLANCSFFKKYEQEEWLHDALKGYVNLYCKGKKQDHCIRKKVSKVLGGPEHVPVNMKPNGQPIIGTTDADWSDEVKKIIS